MPRYSLTTVPIPRESLAPDLLTVTAYAKLRGLARNSVYSRIQAGDIPGYVVAGTLHVSPAEADPVFFRRVVAGGGDAA